MRIKEKKIFELEKIIKYLKKQIDENQDRNDNLLKQFKDEKDNLFNENINLKKELEKIKLNEDERNNNQILYSISNNKNENDQLYQEINELKEKLNRYPIILEKNEELISIIFHYEEKNRFYSIICKNTDSINNLEEKLYKEFPELSGNSNSFLFKGKIFDKFQNFDDNKIKNGDMIIINKN